MLNFGDFLRSPAALGLAQGLLAGSQPSMTQPSSFGGALAQGLGLANQYQMTAQQEAYKRQQDALNNQRLQEQLGLSKEELGLRREKQAQDMLLSQLQMQNLTREQKLKEQQRSILQKALMGTTDAGDESFSKEQRRRASILAATGDIEGAAKVLAEKDPTKIVAPQTIADNQAMIQAIDAVLPQIDELKTLDIPPQFLGISSMIGGNRQTAYEAKLGSITERLMSGLKLGSSDKALELAKKLAKKGHTQTEKAHRKGLDELKNELIKTRAEAYKVTSAVGDKSPPLEAEHTDNTVDKKKRRPASAYSQKELLAITNRAKK